MEQINFFKENKLEVKEVYPKVQINWKRHEKAEKLPYEQDRHRNLSQKGISNIISENPEEFSTERQKELKEFISAGGKVILLDSSFNRAMATGMLNTFGDRIPITEKEVFGINQGNIIHQKHEGIVHNFGVQDKEYYKETYAIDEAAHKYHDNYILWLLEPV